jgi:hypothetical protein
MAIPQIYIDTSVLGGCFDTEFQDDSNQFLREVIIGKKKIFISDLLLLELEDAPREIRRLVEQLPIQSVEYISLNEEAIVLANAYVAEGALGGASLLDARHIAMATLARVDVLVSWNFKHIVNLNRIRQFNAVNLKMGYLPIEIRSPREVIDEE